MPSSHKGQSLRRHDPEALEIPDGQIEIRAIGAYGTPTQLGYMGWRSVSYFAARPQRDYIREAQRAVKGLQLGPFARVRLAFDMLAAAQ